MAKKIILTVLALIIVALPIMALKWINHGEKPIPTMDEFHIDDLALDEQGRVWACYHRGFGDNKYIGVFQADKQITNYKVLDDGSGFCNDIVVDKKGNIWITQFIGGSKKFDGKIWTAIPSREFYALALDKSGRVWVISENSLTVFDEETSVEFNSSNSPLWDNGGSMEFGIVAFDNENRAWISNSDRLYIYDGIDWQIHDEDEFVGIDSITFAKDGKAWITRNNHFVLLTFDGSHFDYLGYADGDHPDKVTDISFDSRGRAWILEGGDLKVYEGGEWRYYVGGSASSMLIDREDQIWLGGEGLTVLLLNETNLESDSIPLLLLADGEFWLIVAILICMWLAYALNSWRGIGLGSSIGALISIFTLPESLRTSSSGQSTETLFPPDSFSGIGFALMVAGAIGGMIGKFRSQPDKPSQEIKGAVYGWVIVVLAVGLFNLLRSFSP